MFSEIQVNSCFYIETKGADTYQVYLWGWQNNLPFPIPKEYFKQMLTNLSFEEEGNIRNILKVSRATNLSLPFQSTRDWDTPHLETRSMCRGLGQFGRFKIRKREKRLNLKVSILLVLREEEGCLDFWVLSCSKGHSPEDTRLRARKKRNLAGGLRCASPSRNSQNTINLEQREKLKSSEPLSCFYQISKERLETLCFPQIFYLIK